MAVSRQNDPSTPEASAVCLDLRGLNCPMPVLRTAKILRKSAPGTRFEIACTDPLAAIDIPHFLAGTEHVLEEQKCENNVLFFYVRRV